MNRRFSSSWTEIWWEVCVFSAARSPFRGPYLYSYRFFAVKINFWAIKNLLQFLKSEAALGLPVISGYLFILKHSLIITTIFTILFFFYACTDNSLDVLSPLFFISSLFYISCESNVIHFFLPCIKLRIMMLAIEVPSGFYHFILFSNA